MSECEIRPIAAEETRLLRHLILRPHQAPETLVYPGDLEPESLHTGAFVDGRLAGIASVVHRPMPGGTDEAGWQLRGMAVLPEFRRKGYGEAMVRACIAHVARNGGTILWCNARKLAVPFYRSLGFAIEGKEFEVPTTGPHFVMWRTVRSENRTMGEGP